MDAAELAVIKALARDHRRECVFGVDWQRIALNLISEIERLQEENARTIGVLGMIMTDVDRAVADGRL